MFAFCQTTRGRMLKLSSDVNYLTTCARLRDREPSRFGLKTLSSFLKPQDKGQAAGAAEKKIEPTPAAVQTNPSDHIDTMLNETRSFQIRTSKNVQSDAEKASNQFRIHFNKIIEQLKIMVVSDKPIGYDDMRLGRLLMLINEAQIVSCKDGSSSSCNARSFGNAPDPKDKLLGNAVGKVGMPCRRKYSTVCGHSCAEGVGSETESDE